VIDPICVAFIYNSSRARSAWSACILIEVIGLEIKERLSYTTSVFEYLSTASSLLN
jgi:hypothetical protein